MAPCLLLEVLIAPRVGVTTVGWLAMAIMVIFGAYAFIGSPCLRPVLRQRWSRPSCRDASAAST